MKENEVWGKILGTSIQSFTSKSKTYHVYYDEDGLVCTCMDFKIRRGSYRITYKDPEEDKQRCVFGCKHIAKFLEDNGMREVYSQKWMKTTF